MKRWKIFVVIAVALFIGGVLATSSRWEGDVTEAAAGPLAEKAGVEETQLLPWSLDGDLLLFVFLAGGTVAGFAAGYSWRKLFAEKTGTDHMKSGLRPQREGGSHDNGRGERDGGRIGDNVR